MGYFGPKVIGLGKCLKKHSMLRSSTLKNKRPTLTLLLFGFGLVILLGLTFLLWPQHTLGELSIYGNVDLRQVSLAFNNSERILDVLIQEGERIHSGQVLARLDTSRLQPRVQEIEGLATAQKHMVDRMHNGNRPQEVAEARANADMAKADSDYARQQYKRLAGLSGDSSGRAVSIQEIDNSKAAMLSADAHYIALKKALELMEIGPRQEDILQAEAQLHSYEGQLGFLRQQLIDAELKAPSEAVVRSRLLEPGEMSSPQRPVFTLALIDPKWIRAYLSELDLGYVHPGMKARIYVDSFKDKAYEGWVGFISPIAEFTPKSVQTEELRPTLSYEVRIFVEDPADDLRLGMPATVKITLPKEDQAH
jgi:HlyD family secretion protein